MKDRLSLRPSALAAVVALLSVYWLMAVSATLHKSTTSDELVHLTAGWCYWARHDYRLHPENGILPQRWAALPAWLSGRFMFPESAEADWKISDAWMAGHRFFYGAGNDCARLLLWGRAMIAGLGVALGALVFAWSRRLFGLRGAFLSLGLFVFCPTLLAHGALATSDLAAALFLLAATGAYWRHLQRLDAAAWALSAVLLGLASVAKFSAPLLLPVYAALVFIRLCDGRPLELGAGGARRVTSRAAQLGLFAASTLAQGAAAVAIIWMFYGFRFSAFHPALAPAAPFIRPWEWIAGNTGVTGRIILALRHWQVLPEAFLYGCNYVVESSQMRGAFLNGEYSVRGWPAFFPIAFLLKTPLPLLLLGFGATATIVLHWHRRRLPGPAGQARLWRHFYAVAPLLVLFVICWAFLITSHLNIGHRHILPVYPVLFILTGVLGRHFHRRRSWVAAGVVALAVWQVAESVRIRPHYLAYFNQIIGGPRHGYRHLVDSSLDWGQDLPGFAGWLAKERARDGGATPVYFSYFGTGEPDAYGIHVTRMQFLHHFHRPHPWYWLKPGYYCFSATMLQQVYSPVRGPWTLQNEAEYQTLRSGDEDFRKLNGDPAAARRLVATMPIEKWKIAWNRYEVLRTARLCHYLRAREPDAMIGYSILIYRVSQAELDAAVHGGARDLARAIEQARARRGAR